MTTPIPARHALGCASKDKTTSLRLGASGTGGIARGPSSSTYGPVCLPAKVHSSAKDDPFEGPSDERRKSLSQEVMVSAITCTKLAVASKGAAWPAPTIRCILAAGMAEASDRVRRNMLSGLRAP